MSAADGVDARARRVAARLLSSRSRRGTAAPGRPPHPIDLPADQATDQAIDRAAVDGGRRSGRRPGAGHPAGAARIARALRALEADGWSVLAQVQRPGHPRGPVLDHLVVGPGGIVVLESRPWAGRIEVTRGVVQQNGFWRERETAALARTAGSIAALLLPQHRTAVHAVICIAQHDLPEHVVAPGVHVVGVSGVARALRALPYRLHPAEVLHLTTVLRHWLVESEAPQQLTTAAFDAFALPARPGAHREPGAEHLLAGGAPVAAPLLVPLTGRGLRPAARSAGRAATRSSGRRQRGRRPWWHNPRVLVPRVLLGSLLLLAALVAGPGVVRAVGHAVGVLPAATASPVAPEGGLPIGTQPVLPEPADAVPADAAVPGGVAAADEVPPDDVAPAATGREDPPADGASTYTP